MIEIGDSFYNAKLIVYITKVNELDSCNKVRLEIGLKDGGCHYELVSLQEYEKIIRTLEKLV